LFAVALAVFLLAMLAGMWVSWQKSSLAYRQRKSTSAVAGEKEGSARVAG